VRYPELPEMQPPNATDWEPGLIQSVSRSQVHIYYHNPDDISHRLDQRTGHRLPLQTHEKFFIGFPQNIGKYIESSRWDIPMTNSEIPKFDPVSRI